ncbi:hypothetical protein C7S20_15475 [Christiangramia fulva]|uniref:DUF3347 domain-containing protein n=1 Tax=Christiangramia fulva TaxID=2126553 RepID=A0A2R3ZB42_9FLAO|nr:DUF3347 domain-containing protein [Christiangramia fulva]AVR47499.1 hypothetical protein C7S20_15475 [Christiangramia fulva]
MRYPRKTTKVLLLTLLSFAAISCKNAKEDEPAEPMSNEMHQQDNQGQNGSKTNENQEVAMTLENYLAIKDALVKDDQEAAAEAGSKLAKELEEFDKEEYSSTEQQELTDIIEDAKEHAEHISESPIAHQREHFDILSKDMIDMIAITGTNRKLFQAYCPMYNDNKGAQWLSSEEEIQNPYMGTKMPGCGKVQKEL